MLANLTNDDKEDKLRSFSRACRRSIATPAIARTLVLVARPFSTIL